MENGGVARKPELVTPTSSLHGVPSCATGKAATIFGSSFSASAPVLPELSLLHPPRTHFSGDLAGFKSIEEAVVTVNLLSF